VHIHVKMPCLFCQKEDCGGECVLGDCYAGQMATRILKLATAAPEAHAAAATEDKGKGCASCDASPCICGPPQVDSATESYDDEIPIGDKYQAEIPELTGLNELHVLVTIGDTATVVTVDGVVDPQPLDCMESRTERQRENETIKRHPERACPDSPSPPPARKRPRSLTGTASRRAGASAGPRDRDPSRFDGSTRGFSKYRP
jgi:hypothetical protein